MTFIDAKEVRALVDKLVGAAYLDGIYELGAASDETLSAHSALEQALTRPPTADQFIATFRCEDNGIVGTTDAKIHSVTRHDDGRIEVVIDHWPKQSGAVSTGSSALADALRAIVARHEVRDAMRDSFAPIGTLADEELQVAREALAAHDAAVSTGGCVANGANVWCNGHVVATANGLTLAPHRAARIATCLNACAGIEDPAALVQAVRDAIDWIVDYVPDNVGGRDFTLANLRRTLGGAALAKQPTSVTVDETYPTPRNRSEAVALARLALAYLGVIDAHIDVATARCETDHNTQQQEPTTCKHDFRRDEDHGGACCQLCGEVRQ